MIRLLFFKCVIANRMLLTVTITVVFVERNFSKLKLIKSYLWLTMLQKMLNVGYGVYWNEVIKQIDCNSIILDFSSKNSRKINLI